MTGERVHLIGIGGDGMSALARLLLEAGYRVSGSDVAERSNLQALRSAGARIVCGHDPRLLAGASRVVVSPAIPQHDPELLAARSVGLRTQSRAEALAEMLVGREVVCIGGSHGKSTTSAMLASILDRAGCDPGFAIGAAAPSLGNVNARLGTGPFVLEACEAFGALRVWRPSHCIVTNVEDEHIEHYGGVAALQSAFSEFIARVPQGGVIAIGGDDAGAVAAAARSGRAAVSFGTDPNDVRALVEEAGAGGTTCTVTRESIPIGSLTLRVAGLHNVRNALGAIACALGMGVSFEVARAALADFAGVERRWYFVGCAGGVRVFDDFAHHPTEIAATLAIARRALLPGGRIVVAFTPQLHSRVRRLAKRFAESLAAADVVIVAPVESAGETAAPSDGALREALRGNPGNVVHAPTSDSVVRNTLHQLRPGDLCVTIGPHSMSATAASILKGLEMPNDRSSATSPTSAPSKLLERIAQTAARRPNAIAVEDGEIALTYAALYDAACRLAGSLVRRGVKRGDLVAVSLEPSVDRVVAFAGVMMAGCAFVPVDPGLPAPRIRVIVEDARPDLAIAGIGCEASFAARGTPVLTVADLTSGHSGATPDRWSRESDLAYVVYTSGSTGTPNGVAIEHAALCNFAAAAVEAFDVREDSRLAQLSAFGFDVAIGEIAMTLFGGASIAMPETGVLKSRAALGAFVDRRAVTHLTLTPSLLSLLPQGRYPALRSIIAAGEPCPRGLIETWAPGRRFFNAYGPTEATIYATIDECFAGAAVTIGRPIDNVSAVVLGDDGRPVRQGDAGELWIGGAGLAREYYERPALTSERFCTMPSTPGTERMYRTGDLVRALPDGRLSFEGRRDRQIKLHGVRIEPAEIETALRAHPAVDDAAVVLDTRGRPRLVAYIVCSAVIPAPHREVLATFLSASLAPAMIPAQIERVASIPIDANGKRDYAALAGENVSPKRPPFSPRTPAETTLFELFVEVLGIDDFGAHDTLDDLGADSVGAVLLLAAIEERFEVELPLDAGFSAQTFEGLASSIESRPKRRNLLDPVDAMFRKQALYLAKWTGERRNDESFVLTHNANGSLPPLYWCFQVTHEHENLARYAGEDRPVHGMRSGYQLFDYTDENVAALASRYAGEMAAMQPSGSFVLGGNCQGGTIALATAQQLIARGRTVALLLLLNAAGFTRFESRVALIFGAQDPSNPYLAGGDCDARFRAAFPRGYTVDLVPGKHAEYFIPPNVGLLAGVIAARMGALDV